MIQSLSSKLQASHPLAPELLRFMGPVLLTSMLQAISGAINNAYLGRLVGPTGLAAAAIIAPVQGLLFLLLAAFAMGAAVLVGRASGADDDDQVTRIGGTALAITALLCGAVGVPAYFAMPWFVQLLDVPPEMFDEAVRYGRFCLPGFFATAFFMIMSIMVRATGDSTFMLRCLVVFCVVLAVATPAFIVGGLGVPGLGAAGAAMGSFVAMAASLAALLFMLRIEQHPLRWGRVKKHSGMDPRLLWEMLRLGGAVAVFSLSAVAADTLVLRLVNAHGIESTAAWGLAVQVAMWVQFPAMASGAAASVFAAKAFGAGDLERLREVTRTATVLCVAIGVVMCGGVSLFATAILAALTEDAAVRAIGVELVYVLVWGKVCMALAGIRSATMRATGVVFWPMVIYVAGDLLVLVPLATLLDAPLGVVGIGAAVTLSHAVAFSLQALYFNMADVARGPRPVLAKATAAGSILSRSATSPSQR
ncbi:MAG: MATE family efflux transporter [Burkholderiales bacterium]|nr:MATE family efflux transporter [Burkholderiales bacterium]